MKNKSIYILIAFTISLFVIIFGNYFLTSNYYTLSDYFGPLSKFPFLFILELLIPVFFMMLFLYVRKVPNVFFFMPLILYIAIIYVGLQLSDSGYITNFFDGVTHIKRGLFVSSTGYSNPQLDSYFDMQSGFFWVTGILSEVCGLQLTSYVNSATVIIVEWSQVFALIIYLPILYILYKRLLGNNFYVSIALLIHLSLEITTFHYAAQTYGRVIYWLILTIMFVIQKKPNKKMYFLALFSGVSLFFIHEGLTIMLLLAFAALVFYPLPFKILSRTGALIRKDFLFLFISLGLGWLIYLSYYTLYQFGNFWKSINIAFQSLIFEGTQIISIGTARADPIWAQIVTYKSIYILILVGLGIVLSYINGCKRKDDSDKLSFGILLFTTIIFGSAAIGLGGAGYLERLPSVLMPLIVYSAVKFFANFKTKNTINLRFSGRNKIRPLIIGVPLILIIFIGSTFYLAGTNFHSVTFGEYYSNAFVSEESSKNVVGIYSNLPIASVNSLILSELNNASINDEVLVSIQRRSILETYYYLYSNMTFINQSISDLGSQMSIVYSNPDVTIYMPKGWETS